MVGSDHFYLEQEQKSLSYVPLLQYILGLVVSKWDNKLLSVFHFKACHSLIYSCCHLCDQSQVSLQ